MELALDGGDASILPLISVGVCVNDEVSVSASWVAFKALSKEEGVIAVDFLLFFSTRLLPATVAVTGDASSDGQAHSDDFGIV